MRQRKTRANKKIETIRESAAEETTGENDPKKGKGKKNKKGKTKKTDELKKDGITGAIGQDPATQLFKDQLKNGQRRLFNNKNQIQPETNIPRCFFASRKCLKIKKF
jgi:Thioredoxin reductase